MSRPKIGDLVAITWADALQAVPYWRDTETAASHAPAKCRSVGFLIARTRKRVVLAQTIAPGHAGGLFVIPADWVQKIKIMESGK